jgi:hypothetical protein
VLLNDPGFDRREAASPHARTERVMNTVIEPETTKVRPAFGYPER